MPCRLNCIVGFCSCWLVHASFAHALPIFGGATYDASTGTGVISMAGQLGGPRVNNAGVAVGTNSGKLSGVDKGYVVTRWSPTLAPEQLQGLGTTSSGQSFPKPSAINDAGVVVGSVTRYNELGTSLGTRPIRWDAGTTVGTELYMSADPTVSGQFGGTSGIDAAGNVYGTIGVTAGFPMRWAAGTTNGLYMPTLGTPTTGHGTGSVSFVAANGIATGSATAYNSSGGAMSTRPVRWNAQGEAPVDFPLVGGSFPKLSDINDHGAVIGSLNGTAVYYPADSTTHTVLKGFAVTDAGSTTARAIGNGDAIVGAAPKYVDGVLQYSAPVIWPTPTATPIELLSDNHGSRTTVLRVNSTGHSVGYTHDVTVSPFVDIAWLWSVDGSGINLQSLVTDPGWTLQSAYDISDTGFVVGEGGYDPDGAGPAATYRRLYSILVPQAGTYGQGDANFDTTVNFADLLVLAAHYGQTNSGDVNVADFNLDGSTNFTDLLQLAAHYATGPTGSFAGDWALAQAIVPEPSVVVSFSFIALLARRRRP
ncbi:MAG: dockerin type I domain-containing protein [Tepidisphaeraceae bacterium]